jgi:hypothetical protein
MSDHELMVAGFANAKISDRVLPVVCRRCRYFGTGTLRADVVFDPLHLTPRILPDDAFSEFVPPLPQVCDPRPADLTGEHEAV